MRKILCWLLVGVILLGAGVYFRRSLPFYTHLSDAMRNYLPLHKTYWTLFHNSDICSTSEVYKGLGVSQTTNRTKAWAKQNSRLQGIGASGLQVWETPFGVMRFPKQVQTEFVYFALAQLKLGAYTGVEIHPGDIVMDCGGFVGDWTKWALRAGASQVIVFEPAAEQLECIRLNLKDEITQGRVVLYANGVWNREERLYLKHNTDNPAANSVTNQELSDSEFIELTTIDRVVDELKLNRLDVVKMDIEGSEIRAIQGARNTLSRLRPQLAIATEHTSDVLQNNRNVIEAIHEAAPYYRMRCGSCDMFGHLVAPTTLYFTPN